jgi:hypothetical protein
MLLEPTAWVKIKVSRGPKALTFKQVLETWAKASVGDEAQGLVKHVSIIFFYLDFS